MLAYMFLYEAQFKLDALFPKMLKIWPQILSNTLKNGIFKFSEFWLSGLESERAER